MADTLGDLLVWADRHGGEPVINALGTAGDLLRYGEGPDELRRLTNSGYARGVSPKEAAGNPLDKRATSAYRGAMMWGPQLSELFSGARRAGNIGQAVPEGPEFTEAAKAGRGRAHQDVYDFGTPWAKGGDFLRTILGGE